jgi:hypothetical protein
VESALNGQWVTVQGPWFKAESKKLKVENSLMIMYNEQCSIINKIFINYVFKADSISQFFLSLPKKVNKKSRPALGIEPHFFIGITKGTENYMVTAFENIRNGKVILNKA